MAAAASVLAGEQRLNLYLAGGVVRDLLLRRPTRDLDLVLEGDGVAFARDLAERLGASLREHARFGTAVLTLPGGDTIDVASARRETYAHPGALPTVVPGASIEEDLARRDFTINAMALGLSPVRRRIDPFGGAADLERGVVRELHSRSYVDDPTRAFRAVRYANRLGFRLPSATRRAIASAPARRALGGVSGDRVRREVRKIFEEPRRGRAVAQMTALGLSRALAPCLGEDRRAAGRVARAETIAGNVGGTTWLCYLLAWMWQTRQREIERVATRLALAGAEGRALRAWPSLAELLSSGGPIAEDLPADALVAAAAGLSARDRRSLLAKAAARGTRLSIRGADLLAAGVPAGPAIGRALAQTLAARREGRIAEAEELAFALAAAGRGTP